MAHGFADQDWEFADYAWDRAIDARADAEAAQEARQEQRALGLTVAPVWLRLGARIDAFTLEEIALTLGKAAAAEVDRVSGPCPFCGLHTLGGVPCYECAEIENELTGGLVFASDIDRDSAW